MKIRVNSANVEPAVVGIANLAGPRFKLRKIVTSDLYYNIAFVLLDTTIIQQHLFFETIHLFSVLRVDGVVDNNEEIKKYIFNYFLLMN